MVFYLGGMNNKFYGLIKSVADAYDEMTRVRDVAHLAIALATLDKAESLQGDTLKIINGKPSLACPYI
jgi:hypothetical protein